MIVPLKLLIALLFIPVVHEQSAGQFDISADERKALIALFEKTGGRDWTHNDGWLGPIGTECRWYGVRCAQLIGRQGGVHGRFTVTDLELENNGLKGQIPPELGALGYLWTLALDGNDIKGPLPDALLRIFDEGGLVVRPISLIHDVEEIFVEVKNQALLCSALRVWILADGTVRREREMCRKRFGRVTREIYTEYQQGKTHEFDHLARSLVRGGFFSDTSLLSTGPWFVAGGRAWCDVTEIDVTAKRIGGVNKHRWWQYPLATMTEWQFLMQTYGVLAEVEWLGKPTTKK